jgi:hypothetical protein
MLRIFRAAFAASLLVVCFVTGAKAEILNAAQWHFSANFPCKSQISGQAADTAVGRLVITIYSCGDDSRYFFVTINDYPVGMVKPANRDNIYAGAVNGSATEVKGTIRTTSVFTLANIDGREYFVDIPDKNGVLRSRLFLVGDRLYQTTCAGNTGIDTSKDCLDFLNSFTLIAVDPLLNPNSPPPK